MSSVKELQEKIKKLEKQLANSPLQAKVDELMEALEQAAEEAKCLNVIIAEHVDAIEAKQIDRKSTRLNSSHRCISYAVFRLKKKKKKQIKKICCKDRTLTVVTADTIAEPSSYTTTK